MMILNGKLNDKNSIDSVNSQQKQCIVLGRIKTREKKIEKTKCDLTNKGEMIIVPDHFL